MSLDEQLARVREAVAKAVSAEDQRIVARTIERNRMLQLAEQSLRVGDILPDFSLPDAEGRTVTSGDLLDSGPLVVAFFRGDWCPYCDVALRALEAARPAIEAVGAALVGISPETPEQLRRTAAAKSLGFPLLSDADSGFSTLCGIRYAIPAAHVDFYRRVGIDLSMGPGDEDWWLPLPAAYVVGRDGVIAQVFVDPDWSYRAEPDALVEAACALSVAPSGDGTKVKTG
jgi:peroxiredoxin